MTSDAAGCCCCKAPDAVPLTILQISLVNATYVPAFYHTTGQLTSFACFCYPCAKLQVILCILEVALTLSCACPAEGNKEVAFVLFPPPQADAGVRPGSGMVISGTSLLRAPLKASLVVGAVAPYFGK